MRIAFDGHLMQEFGFHMGVVSLEAPSDVNVGSAAQEGSNH